MAPDAGTTADHYDVLIVAPSAHSSLPFPDQITCSAALNICLFGADTIGHRRASLSEVKPDGLAGELSSPGSINHPGGDIARP